MSFHKTVCLHVHVKGINNIPVIKLFKIITNKIERRINFQQAFAIRDKNERKLNVNSFQTKSLYQKEIKKK